MKSTHPRWALAALKRRNQNELICRVDLWGFVSVMLALVVMVMFGVLSARDLPTNTVDLVIMRHSTRMPGARREDAMHINIQRDGAIFFGYRHVSRNDLPDLIRGGIRNGAEKRVYISADARAKYQAVEEVLNVVRLAGVENVCFLAESIEH
jgi:biopolymer transport protein ExbD